MPSRSKIGSVVDRKRAQRIGLDANGPACRHL
jgi:hypothetical protein